MLITVPGTKWAIRKCSLEEWLKKKYIYRMVGGQHFQCGESQQQAGEGDSQDTLLECRTWISKLGDASASPNSSPLPIFPHFAPCLLPLLLSLLSPSLRNGDLHLSLAHVFLNQDTVLWSSQGLFLSVEIKSRILWDYFVCVSVYPPTLWLIQNRDSE